MIKFKVLALSTAFILVQGCTMLDNPFGSMSSYDYGDNIYGDDYMHDSPAPPPVHKSRKEDEVPVQMTTKDSQLHALKPESVPTKNNNKNVLLPLSADL